MKIQEKVVGARTVRTCGIQLPEELGWVGGAIVRLRPVESDTDAMIEEARKILVDKGVAAVKVLPRPRSTVLPASVRSRVVARSMREVVDDLLKDVRSDDPELLGSIVRSALDEGGL